MNRRRMRIVERVLEEVIEKERPFNMNLWAARAWDRPGLVAVWDDCGTTACAAGWTARDPEAQDEGLRLNWGGIPAFEDRSGTEAMRRWLGVRQIVAEWLFLPDTYHQCVPEVTPQMVLGRVREILAKEKTA